MTNSIFSKKLSFIAIICSFMLLSIQSNAQYNITVGTGTKSNGSRQFPCPLQDTFLGSRSQYLFRAAELNALRMDSGSINSIGFFVTNLNSSFGVIDSVTVKMGTTTLNSLGATTWVNNLQTVTLTKNVNVSLGKIILPFDFIYQWDGKTNLVVEICTGNIVGQATSNPSILQTLLPAGFNGSRSYAATSPAGNLCSYTGNGASLDSNQRLRPVTIFNWAPDRFCDAVPVVGNVTANFNPICPIQELVLTSNGGTYANLIRYTWQYFDNATSTWKDSGTTNQDPIFSLFQDTTTRYRYKAVCDVVVDSAYSNEINVVTPRMPGNKNGTPATYYINKNHTGKIWPFSDTFLSFNATAAAMVTCGVRSKVTFEVVPGSGPYNEQLVINGRINNSSNVRTITYKGNGETIGFTTTTNSRAVIKLKNTKYFIFDSLVVNANTGNFGIGFQLQNGADSNIIKNCTINSHTSGTGYTTNANSAGIVVGGTDASAIAATDVNSLIDNVQIIHNKINGGASGIVIAAGVNGENSNISAEHNEIRNYYTYGVFLNGNYSANVSHNIISRPNATIAPATTFGVYCTLLNKGTQIQRNRIHSPFNAATTATTAFIGISVDNATVGTAPGLTDQIKVVNNLIYNINGNGNQTGINIGATGNVQTIHNTVSLDDDTANPTNTVTTRCYNQTGTPNAVTVANNIFTITRGGTGPKHCIYILNAATTLFANLTNNNYINDAVNGTNNFIGFWLQNRLGLSDWVAVSKEDSAMNFQPFYTLPVTPNMDVADFNPTNASLDNKGKRNLYTNTDINGTTTSRLDVGCYEFTPPPCIPANLNGVTDIFVANKKVFSDTTICENVQVALKLKITGATGSQTTYQWERSEDCGTTISNFGLPLNQSDTLYYSQALSPADTSYCYRCKITCGGTNYYSNWRRLTVYPAMITGDYYINLDQPKNYLPGAPNGVFNNYSEAISAMKYCGIKGSGPLVKFNVQQANAGNYKEQILLDSIYGIAPTRQVMFKGNNTTIEFPTAGPTPNERAIIKLKRALYINFDSIIVDASMPTAAAAYGFQFLANSDSNSIKNCTIKANQTQAGATLNFAGIVFNSGDAATVIASGVNGCDVNVIENNTITGGTYGITLVGNAANSVSFDSILGNKILDFHTSGIYVAGAKNSLISKNFISRPTRSNVGLGTGIDVRAVVCSTLLINKNRITNFYGGNTNSALGAFGISLNAVDAGTNTENRVINNAVYNLGGTGITYGIQNIGSDGVFYYHNSISIEDTLPSTAATAGFYQNTQAANLEFRNNMISVNRKGTGNKYAIHFNTAASTITSNYNNIFSTSNVGFSNGQARKTLNDWRGNTTQDANSFALDPLFVDNVNGDLKAQFYLIDNKAQAGFATDDINNVARSTTPDIGAFEFTPPACATPLVAGTAIATPKTPLCLEENIRLTLTGHSPLGPINFQWQDSTPGVAGWNNLGPLLFTPTYDTVSSIRNHYRCIVTCATVSSSAISTTDSISIPNVLPAGTYTIDSSLPTTINIPAQPGDNFQSFNDAISALSCGIRGHVYFDVKKAVTGVYSGPIVMPYVKGANANATITFRGFSNNIDNVSIVGTGTGSQNFVLRFDSSTWTTFQDLNIENKSSTNGRVVEFFNRASNSTLLNCNILTPTTTATTTNNSAVFATSFRGTNITVRGNNISNGSNGIYFAGTNQNAGNLTNKGHIIDNNTITNSFAAGINIQFTDKLTVTKNKVIFNKPTTISNSGIFASFCDSGFILKNNKVTIDSQTNQIFGIQVINSRNKKRSGFGFIDGNEIYANSGNTRQVFGLQTSLSDSLMIKNNVIAINSGVGASYGIVNSNHPANAVINYYNNTVQMNINDTLSVAAQLTQTNAAKIELKNNIFSNIGLGKAMFMAPTSNFNSNYNMYFTNGKNLFSNGTTATNFFQSIINWRKTSFNDKWSIIYQPAFVSNTSLRPDESNPNVWAIHGRGIQIKGNTSDIFGLYRADELTKGAPDLGAYEFAAPSVLPPVLPAVPAIPTASTRQAFYFGSDTVFSVKWDINAPAYCNVRRYSGVVADGISTSSRCDSMYFYTTVEIPNNIPKGDIQVYYLDPWLGSVPTCSFECQLGVGKLTQQNKWDVNVTSNNNKSKKYVYETDLKYFNKFTGMINPYISCKGCTDTSNAGEEFWLAYPANQLDGDETFNLYLAGGDEDAEVELSVPGCPNCWTNTPPSPTNFTIQVPANRVVVVRMDTASQNRMRKMNSGKYPNAIHILASSPIVSYVHFTGAASSGATMLMPKCTWGYEYRVLARHQNWGGGSFSNYFVVAGTDNTKIAFNNALAPQNLPQQDTVVLNEGEWYQVRAADNTADLTGSSIKSIPNDKGQCFPLAMFSCDTRTLNSIPCGGGGDFVINQNFPATAWGKTYFTAPTPLSNSNTPTQFQKNLFRIALLTDSQSVYVNNVKIYPNATPADACIENYNESPNKVQGTNIPAYLEFVSGCTLEIKSSKKMMVTQFMSGACSGFGDPDQTFISPIEQGVSKINFFRNTLDDIDSNTLVLIGLTKDTPTLKEYLPNGTEVPLIWKYIYNHWKPGYSVYVKQWTSAQRQVSAESKDPKNKFTAITFGQGSVESYMYNAGTNILNFFVPTDPPCNAGISDTSNCVPSNTTCSGTKFRVRFKIADLVPDSIRVYISNIPSMAPNKDVVLYKPYDKYITKREIRTNGDSVWSFQLDSLYTILIPGQYTLIFKMWNDEYEGCDKSLEWRQLLIVKPMPVVDFAFSPKLICQNSLVTYVADSLEQNEGRNILQYNWSSPLGINFPNSNLDTINHFYPNPGNDTVRLHYVVDQGNCIGDTSHIVTVNPTPVIKFVNDSVHVCSGSNTIFQIANPIPGATYTVYDALVNGNQVGQSDGTTPFSFPGVTQDSIYYVECVSASGCISDGRKPLKIKVSPLPVPNANPVSQYACLGTSAVFTVTSDTSANTVNTWYNVATGGTPIYTGNTFTTTPVTGDSTFYLEATTNSCISASRFAVNVIAAAPPSLSVVAPSITVCKNENATFQIANVDTSVKYNWYTTATGGTATTDTVYTISNAQTTNSFWVSATSKFNCTSAPRLKVDLVVVDRPIVTVVKDVDSVCSGGNISINISNPIANATYTVYDAATNGTVLGTPSDGTTPFTFNNVTANTTYYIECKLNATGCISDTRKAVSIQVIQIPTATAGITPQNICIGYNAIFKVINPNKNQVYTWWDAATAGTQVTGDTTLTINNVAASATYYLEVKDWNCVSASRFPVVLTAVTAPTVNVVQNPVTVCANNSATFNILNPNNTEEYNWYTLATGGSIAAPSGNSVTLNNLKNDTSIYVDAKSSNGCISVPRLKLDVKVTQRPIVTVINPDSVAICQGMSNTFGVLNPVTGVTYSWYNNATGGTSLKDSTNFTTPALATADAMYYVDGTFATCTSVNRTPVKVKYLANLDTVSVTGSIVFTDKIEFNWNAMQGANAYILTISVNGGLPYTVNYGSTTLMHTITGLKPGDTASCVVTAVGVNNCQNSVSSAGRGKTVVNATTYPNTFTPNGDGFNDKAVICGSSIKMVQYMVFNQWGEKIWEKTSTAVVNGCVELWDGTQRGVPQPVGVYPFIARITYNDNTVSEKKGMINLIR